MKFLRISILMVLVLGLTIISLNSIEKASQTATDTSFKVMTFNVRNANSNDGVNNWDAGNRKQRAFDIIGAANPDIICVQEAIDGTYGKQVTDLQNLAGYKWYGVGRDDGQAQGEREGIMYKYSRFTLQNQGQFWISWTPDTPGTTFATSCMNPSWDNGNARMATWVILKDALTGKSIFVLNQHWAVAEETQTLTPNEIRAQINKLRQGLPIITTGDFNMTDAPPSDPNGKNIYNGYQVFLTGSCSSETLKLIDAYRSIHPTPTVYPPGETTYHAYHGGTCFWDYQQNPADEGLNYRIDFIMVSSQFKVTQADILRDSYSSDPNQWPSDHYPVAVVLSL